MSLPPEIEAAITRAQPEDEVRTAEGALAALSPCIRHCTVCDGEDHHWMADCDDAGEPVMVCKHCPAWREIRDDEEEEEFL